MMAKRNERREYGLELLKFGYTYGQIVNPDGIEVSDARVISSELKRCINTLWKRIFAASLVSFGVVRVHDVTNNILLIWIGNVWSVVILCCLNLMAITGPFIVNKLVPLSFSYFMAFESFTCVTGLDWLWYKRREFLALLTFAFSDDVEKSRSWSSKVKMKLLLYSVLMFVYLYLILDAVVECHFIPEVIEEFALVDGNSSVNSYTYYTDAVQYASYCMIVRGAVLVVTSLHVYICYSIKRRVCNIRDYTEVMPTMRHSKSSSDVKSTWEFDKFFADLKISVVDILSIIDLTNRLFSRSVMFLLALVLIGACLDAATYVLDDTETAFTLAGTLVYLFDVLHLFFVYFGAGYFSAEILTGCEELANRISFCMLISKPPEYVTFAHSQAIVKVLHQKGNISAGDFFVVNKSTMLTIIGALSSYLLVITKIDK